jgi:hypothetical protein
MLLHVFSRNDATDRTLIRQGRATAELSLMPNNQQPPQNEPRRAQPGQENPGRGREDMERPERDEDRIERERRERDKRPQ